MEGTWIIRLLDRVAPRSWRDATLKAVVFIALINAVSFVVKTAIRPPPIRWPREVAITTLVALPFVVFAMAILIHQRRLQQAMSVLARTDMLTGLPNRRDFMDRARAALDRDGEGMLLLLDADHFKRLNDRWGHAVGDAALAAIGARLRGVLREGDLLARLGGEEFAAFLPAASPKEAQRLGERLCAPIPVAAADPGLSVTLSVGAAQTGPGTSLDRLMAQADRALYRAKAEGRARLALWEEEQEQDRAA